MPKESFFKIKVRKTLSKTDESTYTSTYGAWIKDLFQNQKKAKEQLFRVMNALHKNQPKAAVHILNTELKTRCKTAEEKTAWLFFMGIAHEAMEQTTKAFLYFTEAEEYEQKIPLVLLKSANCAYQEGLFGFAAYNNREAIRLLEKESEQNPILLASAYASLSLCLTMMHEYQRAEEALQSAEKTAGDLPEAQSARILLYAARKEFEKANAVLKIFPNQNQYGVKCQLEALRSGTNEQFCTMNVENSEINAFWQWFSTRLETYLTILDTNQTKEISKMTAEISAHLKKVFPFTKHSIRVFAYKNEVLSYSFFVSDLYAQALSEGLIRLFAQAPETIKKSVRWIKIH